MSHKWLALARMQQRSKIPTSSSVKRCNMIAWEVPTQTFIPDDYLRAKEYLVRLYPNA